MRPLRIAYVTTGSASDVNNWSGIVYHIRASLKEQGHEAHDIDKIETSVPLRTRLRGWWARSVEHKPYGYDRDLDLARAFARSAERQMQGCRYDIIVAPRTYPIALLRTGVPIATWSDATFQRLLELYPGVNTISRSSIR